MFKKYISICLCFVMALMTLSVNSVMAEDMPVIIQTDKTSLDNSEDKLTVSFSLPEDTVYNGVEINVEYPSDKLTLVSSEKGAVFANSYLNNVKEGSNAVNVIALHEKTITGGGDIISLVFSQVQGAAGSAVLKITGECTTVEVTSTSFSEDIIVQLASATPSPTANASGNTSKPGSGHSGVNNSLSSPTPGAVTPLPTESPINPEPEVTKAPTDFTDIDGHWAENSINRLAQAGLVNGFEDNTFRPDLNVTRAQFITMLVTAMDLDSSASMKIFDDVDVNAWYAPYVTAAYSAGITEGDGTNFHPESEITRQEVAAMVARAFKLNGTGNISFADSADIADWARESVDALVSDGIIQGFEDNTFRPNSNATRAQAVIILDKLLN